MLFNTLQYAYFLPLVVAAFYLSPPRARLGLLLAASYVFYASWSPVYLFLIAGLTLMNYLLGLAMARVHSRRPEVSHWFIVLGVVLNLGVLGYYKYTAFLLTNVAAALHLLGVHARLPVLSPFIPLGISFFVFEFIHYLMDIRKGHPAVGSLVKFATFAAFFPTQIAGPIKRYEDFIPQLENTTRFEWARVGAGLQLIVVGLFKKVALADNLSPLVQLDFQHVAPGLPSLGHTDAWLAVIAFTVQIYFDFSGYTDIGRGSALMLGYSVPENFNRPYLARNISDFWRRWHISLSSWLRDYLYIPLGGNRAHRNRNLFLTMAIGGLWHGANWTYIAWGALQGAALVAYWNYNNLRRGAAKAPPAAPPGLAGLLLSAGGIALTFLFICITWVFFRAADLTQAFSLLHSMFGRHTGHAAYLSHSQRLFVALVFLGTLLWEASVEWRGEVSSQLDRLRWRPGLTLGWQTLQPSAYVALFLLTLIVQPNTAPQFIYFRF